MLCFAGGGMLANGKFVFDANGKPLERPELDARFAERYPQHRRRHDQGASNGTVLSPTLTGFTGVGVDGIGWGIGVALDKVWVTGLNGTIGVMDFDGRPIGKETDFPFAGQVGGLQGVGISANGDLWIADATKSQLLYSRADG